MTRPRQEHVEAAGAPFVAVDWLKAGASQLIVWHHLALYGPMSDVVQPQAPALVGWLVDHARIAVQVFLVVAGFLAAHSLLGRAGPPPAAVRLVWRRYLRLARPYFVALVLAVAAAALARALVAHPTIPAAPTAAQLAAHALLLHDVAGVDALSAGVWYVAIDVQLYALFVVLFALAQGRAVPALALVAALAVASLFWFNRDASLDAWAPYFWGAYALGIGAWWASRRSRRAAWAVALAAVVLLALALDWRNRIALAGATALLLVVAADRRLLESRVVAWAARISYPLFLVHYPVALVVGALVWRLWPTSVAANAAGLVAAWLASLLAAALLHRVAEPVRVQR
jgi:peptidoglycan/LPS O-acetylase OafA/YrhL